MEKSKGFILGIYTKAPEVQAAMGLARV